MVDGGDGGGGGGGGERSGELRSSMAVLPTDRSGACGTRHLPSQLQVHVGALD